MWTRSHSYHEVFHANSAKQVPFYYTILCARCKSLHKERCVKKLQDCYYGSFNLQGFVLQGDHSASQQTNICSHPIAVTQSRTLVNSSSSPCEGLQSQVARQRCKDLQKMNLPQRDKLYDRKRRQVLELNYQLTNWYRIYILVAVRRSVDCAVHLSPSSTLQLLVQITQRLQVYKTCTPQAIIYLYCGRGSIAANSPAASPRTASLYAMHTQKCRKSVLL